jgi:transcriptional regulator with XRE-family HTH domain
MLNERIRNLRLAKGLTLQAVADVFGISRASIASWESGNSNPDHKKLEELANLFGCSLQYLLTGKDLPQLDSDLNSVYFVPIEKLKSKFEISATGQKVRPLHSITGSKTFATRYFGQSELNWSPGSIPSGSLIIVEPNATPTSNSLVLLQASKNAEIHLAQIKYFNNKQFYVLDDAQKTQIPFEQKVRIIGVILEWQLSAKIY